MNVEEIMTEDVTTIEEDANLGAALEIMEERRIRHLPVVRGSEVVGMLSDRDMRGLGLSLVTDLESFETLRGRLGATVASAMSTNILTVERESDVTDCLALFIEEKVGAIPVVEGDSRDLVGIVSTIDLLRALRDQLS